MKVRTITNKKRKQTNIWTNNATILCQPDVTLQCECKLASSFSTENSSIK